MGRKSNAVRNPQGVWINTQLFREAALRYQKTGRYCEAPWGTDEWEQFWREERRRCMEGYAVGGARITGDHYFYLNYCPIRKVESTSRRVTSKTTDFPDFWDGDYNYFWSRSIARTDIAELLLDGRALERFRMMEPRQQTARRETLFKSLGLAVRVRPEDLEGGWNLIVGKSRRRGYSYKNAAIAANNYLTRKESLTIMNAYDKRFLAPNGLFSMAVSYVNFTNAQTAWRMPSDKIKRSDHIRNSSVQYENGIEIEVGFMSEIQAITCKDNPDANRGKDALDIFIEEAGAFGTPGLLKEVYMSSEDCVKAGELKTGMITLFGTSGDLEGGTVDYAEMFNSPRAFKLLPFDNIWDDGMGDTQCGFFHPISWNLEGHYDAHGNSNVTSATESEKRARQEAIDAGASTVDVQRRMQEKPLTPSEAFSVSHVSLFPLPELNAQLNKVRAHGWGKTKGVPMEFVRENGRVLAKPILSGAKPITSLKSLPDDLRGCPVIYEPPKPNAPRGTYKIGYDPVRQDTGTSLAGLVVYKSAIRGGDDYSTIVAEYLGRGEMAEDSDRMAEYFADYYGAQIMYENECIGTKNYFMRIKRLHLLARQPNSVISKSVRHSRVNRVFGCHMNTQLKDVGERYVRDWLLSVLDYDEQGQPVRAYEKIYSTRVLEELISYNRGGNFDLVSALIMCMFQEQDEREGVVQQVDKAKAKANQLLEMGGFQ